MALKLFKAKVPGSLMLMGEHAVLQGKPALVAAINRYIHITLTPRADKIIQIHSALGSLETSLEKVEIKAPFQFVLAAIQYMPKINNGFELSIESEFSDKIGFGSSAAVLVATLKVLYEFIYKEIQTLEILQVARSIIIKVQGKGSGADAAASVFGGIIYFHAEPLQVEKLIEQNINVNHADSADAIKMNHAMKNSEEMCFPNLYSIYSGNKVPTEEVITIIQKKSQNNPKLFSAIFNAIAICTEQARTALKEKNWKQLGELMNIHHGLQSAMGVSNEDLENLVYQLRNKKDILGAKISGAGLGDCVIGLGNS